MSADPENEFFADGITEDVIAHLAKIRTLRVTSRTSVMAFKRREQSLREIGAALGVGVLVEGSVRRSKNRVRIVAQLVDPRTDQHLWAETYDRELDDIFAIQTDVALQIAAALRGRADPRRARADRAAADPRSRGLSALPAGSAPPVQVHPRGSHAEPRVLRAGGRARPGLRPGLRRDGARAHPVRHRGDQRRAARGGLRPRPAGGGPRAGARRRSRRGARHRGPAPLHARPGLEGSGSGVPAGADAQPRQRGHLRPPRLALFGPGALRRVARAGAAGARARSARAPQRRRATS